MHARGAHIRSPRACVRRFSPGWKGRVGPLRIARIAPLAYTPGKLEYFSFIRSGDGAEYHQNPLFYQFASGEVMIYWLAYDVNENNNNGVVLYSISRDHGITWSDPQVYLADYVGGIPFYSHLLTLRDQGVDGGNASRVIMMTTQHLMEELVIDEARRVATGGGDPLRSRTRIILRRSNDGGRSFDHGEELPYQLVTGGKALPGVGFYGSLEHLIQLDSGRIVAAFPFIDPERSNFGAEALPYWKRQHFTVACLLSDDGGQTWKRSSEITVDTDRGAMEPQIAEVAPNRLLCLLRTKAGCLYQSTSDDGGQTWSPAVPSPLPSPESMPRMIRLQSGNLLVVWNNVSSTTQQPRHPLAAAVSHDGGRSWSEPKVIADETGSNQLSNHGLIQLDDGRILLGVSHYHDVRPAVSDLDVAIFDEAWLNA